MREWMLGEVDGWIKPAYPRDDSLVAAWGRSHSLDLFVFVWDNGNFVGARSLVPYIANFCKRHKKMLRRSKIDKRFYKDTHFLVYCLICKNLKMQQKAEREVLALLNPEEKTNDQSD